MTGCAGPLIASRAGPGAWLWRQPPMLWMDRYAAQGASYIRLPLILPPDPRTAYRLVMEGLLGLVWSSGTWFASPAAEKLLGGMANIHSKGTNRRDIRSAAHGNAYARPPYRVRYPDALEVSGTRYTASNAEDFMYISEAGDVPDLTT